MPGNQVSLERIYETAGKIALFGKVLFHEYSSTIIQSNPEDEPFFIETSVSP